MTAYRELYRTGLLAPRRPAGIIKKLSTSIITSFLREKDAMRQKKEVTKGTVATFTLLAR